MSQQRKPPLPKVHTPMLTGLSIADRDLMLAMMAALGSNCDTMLAVAKAIGDEPGFKETAGLLDDEVNANIDLIKACKERLKPGRAVLRAH